MLGFWFGLWLWLGLWLGSEQSVRVLIFPSEPFKECVKVSHVIFECRVINHHPKYISKYEIENRKMMHGKTSIGSRIYDLYCF